MVLLLDHNSPDPIYTEARRFFGLILCEIANSDFGCMFWISRCTSFGGLLLGATAAISSPSQEISYCYFWPNLVVNFVKLHRQQLAISYTDSKQNLCKQEEKMNRKNGNNINSSIPRLDLRLNLSPPSSTMMFNLREESESRSPSLSPTNSCVSSEMSMKMVLVGCPRCLMYVMLSEDDPKCPKCKSTVLLGFHHDRDYNDDNHGNNGSSSKTRVT